MEPGALPMEPGTPPVACGLGVAAEAPMHQKPLIRPLRYYLFQEGVYFSRIPVNQLIEGRALALYAERLVIDHRIPEKTVPSGIDRDNRRPRLHRYGDDAF